MNRVATFFSFSGTRTNYSTAYHVLFAVATAHLLNDLIQSAIPALYPRLQQTYGLSLTQIGTITLFFQLAACVFQPLVGYYGDKYPRPFLQLFGMFFTSAGVVALGLAPTYEWIIVAVTSIGIGSSIFHPEAARIAYVSSGGRKSLAQSIFQLGGTLGSAMAPLLVAWIILPGGQWSILYLLILSTIAKIILYRVGQWRMNQGTVTKENSDVNSSNMVGKTSWIVLILLILIISKYFYTAAISSYFQFYTMARFGISDVDAQLLLFVYLLFTAIGTVAGGLIGDRLGRRRLIWFSILGAAPFTLALPYVGLELTGFFIAMIGLIISSAFPAILVYAQELFPRKLGIVSGFFYGFAFGVGGVGSALLGWLADHTSLEYIYSVISYLPLAGLIAFFLPDLRRK